MNRTTTWLLRIGFVVASAGALHSRDACLGGSRPPPPDPPPASARPTATAAPATPEPTTASSGTFAAPP